MRFIKLAKPEFATPEKVREFFLSTLPRRDPPGRFEVNKVHNLLLKTGDRLVFSFERRAMFTALTSSDLIQQGGDKPNYFVIDLSSLRPADEDLLDIQKRYNYESGERADLTSQAWNLLRNQICVDNLWDWLRSDHNTNSQLGPSVMTINQAERAYRAWPILTKRAGEGNNITYGELGALLAVHHRAIRYVLGLIQDYCLEEKLPPLTILIVNQSGKPGTGFIAYDVDKLEEGRSLVHSYNWSAISNPFAFASDGTTYEEIVRELAGDPSSAADIMRMVKTRGVAQSLFRDALLRAYQYRCAFTGISFQPVLEACHIVPWSMCKPEERLDVRNGLLLNSVHHKLFDEGLVTLTRDFRIWYVDPDLKEGPYSEYDLLMSANLHSKLMQMPRPDTMRPAETYLLRSHELHAWQQHLPT